LSFFINPELYTGVILPVLIFLACICDVSMETIRGISIARGITYLAPIIAFSEIVIWLLAREVVMRDLSNKQTFWQLPQGLQWAYISGS
jgi:uncharacterized protein YebE (UPF0316 family)